MPRQRGRSWATAAALLGIACSSTPPFAGWTADQLFEHGRSAFEEEDWDEARRAFERLALTFPGFDSTVAGRHYLAGAFFSDEEYLSAVSEYTRIVQVHPDDERAPEAWMGLCRSYAAMSPNPQRDQQYTVQARTTCQNVASDFPGTPIGDSAAAIALEMHGKLAAKAYGEGYFYFQRDILESAELVFLDLVDSFEGTVSAPRAMARLIDIYEEWGWSEQREEIAGRLRDAYPDSPEAKALEQTAPTDTATSTESLAPPRTEYWRRSSRPQTTRRPSQPWAAGCA